MLVFFQNMSKGLLHLRQTSIALHLFTEPAISPQKKKKKSQAFQAQIAFSKPFLASQASELS